MSRYKVLSLPAFLGVEDYENFHMFNDEWIETKKEIEPIFNRYGYYLDRKKNICWAETRFGCWIIGNRLDFKCEFEYQSNDEYILHKDVTTAFKLLYNHRMLSKDMFSKWYMHNNALELRDACRIGQRMGLQIRKEIEKESSKWE